MTDRHTYTDNVQTTLTVADWAAQTGRTNETAMRFVRLRIGKGLSLSSALSAEHLQMLSANKRTDVQTVSKPTPVKRTEIPQGMYVTAKGEAATEIAKAIVQPNREPQVKQTDWLLIFERCALVLLAGIFIAHGGLIWYEVNAAFSVAGFIAGLTLFLVVMAGGVVVLASHLSSTSAGFLWVVALLDAASIYVHYLHFAQYKHGHEITLGLSAFVAGSGFASFYFFRHIITTPRA